MSGGPYNEAKKGLGFALKTLKEGDRFGIVAFDHEQTYFTAYGQDLVGSPPEQPLVEFNQQNVEAASK